LLYSLWVLEFCLVSFSLISFVALLFEFPLSLVDNQERMQIFTVLFSVWGQPERQANSLVFGTKCPLAQLWMNDQLKKIKKVQKVIKYRMLVWIQKSFKNLVERYDIFWRDNKMHLHLALIWYSTIGHKMKSENKSGEKKSDSKRRACHASNLV
jgi:hypothetical protein